MSELLDWLVLADARVKEALLLEDVGVPVLLCCLRCEVDASLMSFGKDQLQAVKSVFSQVCAFDALDFVESVAEERLVAA